MPGTFEVYLFTLSVSTLAACGSSVLVMGKAAKVSCILLHDRLSEVLMPHSQRDIEARYWHNDRIKLSNDQPGEKQWRNLP